MSLGYRVLGYVLLVCAGLALVTTSMQVAVLNAHQKSDQLARAAQNDRDVLERLNMAAAGGQASEINAVLAEALTRPDVDHISVTGPDRADYVHGTQDPSGLNVRHYEVGAAPGAMLTIGRSLAPIHQHLARQALPILLTELAQGLLVGLIVLLVFERLAASRLRRLTHQVLNTSWRSGDDLTALERSEAVLPDEINNIITAFETMRCDARDAFARLEREQRRGDRLNCALQIAQKEQASLTRALSHDLMTPVNTMRALVTEFRTAAPAPAPTPCPAPASGQTADDTLGLLQDMDVTAARMTKQIQDVMRYSELLAAPPCPQNTALEDVLQAVRQTLLARYNVLPGQIMWGPLGEVFGDPRDLTLLFEALVTNAITYAHPDRALQIRVQRAEPDDPEHVKIVISDTGRGIPDQHIDAVLDLFSRLHTYADIPGTGLGLALCRRVMHRHHGTIRLSSDRAQGTQVTLVFPKGGHE